MVRKELIVFKNSIMKQLLFCLFLAFSVSLVNAQRYPVPEIDSLPFPQLFQLSKFTPPAPDSNGKGISGLCWVKFKPSILGKPEHLTFSPKTNQELQKIITGLFDSLNLNWPSQGFESNDKVDNWIVLPVQYEFRTKSGTNLVTIASDEINEFFVAYDSFKEQRYIFLSTATLSSSAYPRKYTPPGHRNKFK